MVALRASHTYAVPYSLVKLFSVILTYVRFGSDHLKNFNAKQNTKRTIIIVENSLFLHIYLKNFALKSILIQGDAGKNSL